MTKEKKKEEEETKLIMDFPPIFCGVQGIFSVNVRFPLWDNCRSNVTHKCNTVENIECNGIGMLYVGIIVAKYQVYWPLSASCIP